MSIEAEVLTAEIESSWMTPLKQYITNRLLPNDLNTAQKVLTSAAHYIMVQGGLYHTMGDWPLLKYVSESGSAYILKEMYERNV